MSKHTIALVVLLVALLGLILAPAASADENVDLPDSATVVQAVLDGANTTVLPPQPGLLAVPGDDRTGCNADYLDTSSAGCVTGDPNGTRTVVLWGDSHAWMWLPAFDAIGKESQTQIVQFDKSSCAPPDMRVFLDRLRRAYTECDDYRSFVEGRIASLHPDVVVLTSAVKGVRLVDGSQQAFEDEWASGLATTIHAVAPYTREVVVLGDSAYPVQEPADCLSTHANDVQACGTPRSGAIDEYGLDSGVFDEHNRREQQVTEQSGARYVSVTQWLCTDTVCPAVVGGLGVYRDYFHVSPNYAYWLSKALGVATGLLLAPVTPAA
jgi:hypothetical protein